MAAPYKRLDVGGVALQLRDACRSIAHARLAVNAGASKAHVTHLLTLAQRSATLAEVDVLRAIQEAPPDD